MKRTAEKFLYLLSPIGLLALWEGLLQFGIGDRRFIPTPSDVFVVFVEVTRSGECMFCQSGRTQVSGATPAREEDCR